MSAFNTLNTFTIDNLPDLDVAVLGALLLFSETKLPAIPKSFKRPIVIGSGNAEYTGRIIFKDTDAVFADESSYEVALERAVGVDGAVLISASGGKHSIEIAKFLKSKGLLAVLLTNNKESPASEYFEDDTVIVFPKNREPYTYNTSTYLGMILANEEGDAASIRAFIETHYSRDLIPSFSGRQAFTFVLPSEFRELRAMLRTKFDELFGPKLVGRFFIPEELKHAKTVVRDQEELFINFTETALGKENELRLSLPESYAGAMAVTYYLVGLIQSSKPPYFKDNIVRYCEESSAVFGQDIKPIVE